MDLNNWKDFLVVRITDSADYMKMCKEIYGVYTPDLQYALTRSGKWQKTKETISNWISIEEAQRFVNTHTIELPPNYPAVPKNGDMWTCPSVYGYKIRKTGESYKISGMNGSKLWKPFNINDAMARFNIFAKHWIPCC